MEHVHVAEAVPTPPSTSPYLVKRLSPSVDVDLLWAEVLSGRRASLARAVTLIESRAHAHAVLAEELLERAVRTERDSFRIGITGPPGVGKSSLIEALGLHILEDKSQSLAVLAVDPSSEDSRGSVLGDKSRMAKLAMHPKAFIRPSPTSGNLTGIADTTHEVASLCQAAGFRTLFVETVGVGQVETAVAHLVDCFLYLSQPGAGDELQGIKRGAVERADVIAITKADGPQETLAQRTAAQTSAALSLFRPREDGWAPPVLQVSAHAGRGIGELWEALRSYLDRQSLAGRLQGRRAEQRTHWLRESAIRALLAKSDALSGGGFLGYSQRAAIGEISSRRAVREWLESGLARSTGR